MKYRLFVVIAACFFISCEYVEHIIHPVTYKEIPANEGVKHTIEKAYYIANIGWKATRDIKVSSHEYGMGTIVRGLPYSSARELDCFVGIQVSFHTFITATNNPYSLFYTEDISKPPYHSNYLCSVYYGTVCSCAVEYALGIDVPYFTSLIDRTPIFVKSQGQTPEDIQLGSVLLSPGHMVMVTDIERARITDKIVRVSILESAGYDTRIKTYSINSFYNRWYNDGWVIYNYADISNNTKDSWLSQNVDLEDYDNLKLLVCPSKGDKSCYREDEKVVINVLTDTATKVVLLKDGTILDTIDSNITQSIGLSNLEIGDYVVELYQEDELLDICSFAVIETDVQLINNGQQCRCNFYSSNATPHYVSLCSIDGIPYEIILIEDTDRLNGYIDLPQIDKENYFCKVMFKHSYGQISNEPIQLD